MIKKEIIPHYGFDKLKLGLSTHQVEFVLGKAASILNESYADNSQDKIWNYNNLGVDLIFSSDNEFLLGAITFHSENFLFKKEKLIGLSESDFIKKISELNIPDLNLEDDFTELNSKDYYSDLNGLSFWIQDGIVDSITLFPKYQSDDETPIWPN